jgi:hypothetical protein
MLFLDRLKMGWEILGRLAPEIRERASPFQPDTARPIGENVATTFTAPPTLQSLVEEIGVLPPYSIIIGGCDDKSHIFLDLTDPAPGSILISGDSQSGKTRLLESILTSACMLNSPRRVRYAVISSKMDELQALTHRSHCYKAVPADSDEAADLIFEMAEIVEQRRAGRPTGTAIILAIDDLACFLNGLDDEAIEQLRWLVESGPEVQIWTLATLNSGDVKNVDVDLINIFSTRLIGSIESPETATYLNGSPTAKPSDLISGEQFSVQFGEDWVRFWIPVAEEVIS